MRVVLDIEANSLVKPTHIWVIVCKDIDTGVVSIFRGLTEDATQKEAFKNYIANADLLVGHNIIEYDLPIINSLLGIDVPHANCLDTLILSRLINYSRVAGHSLESFGVEFGLEKIKFNDFKQYSQEMEDYCVRDVEISHHVWNKFSRTCDDANWSEAIRLEHDFQLLVNSLHDNGFSFNIVGATKLLDKVNKELHELDAGILRAFPPREVIVRTFTPRSTKFGTISKSSIPVSLRSSIHEYEIGRVYNHTKTVPFNPSSHKQLIEVLHEAGWKPENKTGSHIITERAINSLKYSRGATKEVDLTSLSAKMVTLGKFGWKINEHNLNTLPPSAPSPARLLAKRILLESRRRTLTEWLGLVHSDSRIHGKFLGIGAWTHRMAHQKPNTANIPSATNLDGSTKLLGKEMRSLWQAPRNRLLVGVDAEGIQLRIFAHYIDDKEFTNALVMGRKDDRTDPHSLNQRILGSVCKSRAAAKRFVFALLLGAGIGKLTQILDSSTAEARDALARLMERYTGFKELKETTIVRDSRRGWFRGLDGRQILLPGTSERDNRHLCMSGYLQAGEAVVLKRGAILWHRRLRDLGIDFKFVNMVHDEWQTECANNMDTAMRIAKVQAESFAVVGTELGLRCPLAGSYWNEDNKDFTIGTNWYTTH